MKICYLAPSNSIHSHRWINYFVQKGHDVNWISLAKNTIGEIACRYREIDIRLPFFGHYAAARKVRVWLREIQPDVLHVHSCGTYGLVGALAHFKPTVVTAWGSDVLFSGFSALKGPLVRFALRNADIVTCDAEHMRKAMIRLGTHDKKIKIIFFGIDTQKFTPGRTDPEWTNITQGNPNQVVISLRNFEPVYDLETLIRAVPSVLEVHPGAFFLIAGKGPQETHLKELAASLGIANRVRFLGHIPNQKLPTYLAQAAVYVSTSLSDAGIAASTAEAMACGVPVVVTDSGENARWIENGVNGFLVPIKSPVPLAQQIAQTLSDPQLARQMGLRGREVIREKNDYQGEMGKMETLYHELCRSQKN